MAVGAALFAVVAVLLSLIYYLSKSKFDYWKRRNVPHPKPTPLFGNYKEYILLRKSISDVVNGICEQFPKEPYIGAFMGTEPTLIVRDLEYIKLMLTKDFYYFNSREVADHTHKEIITKNLFFISGDRWKVIRQNVTPLFSLAKMKKMFYLIAECAEGLETAICDLAKKPSVEVRDLMARFTIDCIGNCAFGVNPKALYLNNVDNPFLDISNKIFEPSFSRGFKLVSRSIWPSIFYRLGLKAFPSEIPEFFNKFLAEIFEQRQFRNSGRHDFVDLILELKENKYMTGDSISNMNGETKKIQLEVDHDLLCAQCVVFFGAGFETSATTLSFILFELAKNPDIQNRVIEEVDEYFSKNGKILYESVSEMPYLEACISETLRLYPVLGVMKREVVEDYKLPSGVLLTKGTRIHIPVHHLHHHPEHFTDPEIFKPERFLGTEKEKIKPFTYMPFGEGPRFCVGMRFAKMQMTAGLLTILRKVRLEIAPDTKMEVSYEPGLISVQPNHGINLKMIPRN